MSYSHLLLIDAIHGWGPLCEIEEEGLTEKEIDITARSIAETLSQAKILSKQDKIVMELEEFLYDVLQEYGISVTDDLLEDLVGRIVSAHNRAVRINIA